jgi:hypothetical protein
MSIDGLEATPQLVLLVAGAGCDDLLRLAKARVEGVAFAGPDFEDGDFEDDGELPGWIGGGGPA